MRIRCGTATHKDEDKAGDVCTVHVLHWDEDEAGDVCTTYMGKVPHWGEDEIGLLVG